MKTITGKAGENLSDVVDRVDERVSISNTFQNLFLTEVHLLTND